MTGTFKSLDNKTYEVRIGNTTGNLVFSNNPVHITWQKGDHIYKPIITVSATIRIRTTEAMPSLYAEGPMDIQVVISELDAQSNRSVLFDGFLTPHQWDSPDTGIWDEVELEAVDRLSALKLINYTRTKENFTEHDLSMPTMWSIVEHAMEVANIQSHSKVNVGTLSDVVNEMIWLPKAYNASIHSDERTPWTDVLEAIAVFNKFTFVYWKATLYLVDVDYQLSNCTLLSINERSTDSAGVDISSSIEPSVASIKVAYGDTDIFSFSPDIDITRKNGTVKSTSTVQAQSDDEEYAETTVTLFRSLDWINTSGTDYDSDTEPSDHRPTLAHLLAGRDNYTNEYDNDDWCIVGPCHLKADARKHLVGDSKVKVTWDAWYGSNCGVYSTDAGNPPTGTTQVPFIRDSAGNVTKMSFIKLNSDDELESIWKNKPGFQTMTSTSTSEMSKGIFDIFVPANWCIRAVKIEATGFSYDAIQELGEEKIYSISDDYNSDLSVSATLRPCSENRICAADIKTSLSKYPFVNPLQVEHARRRIKASIVNKSGLTPFAPIATESDNNKVYWPESADIDLRENCTKVSILQTYASTSR